MRVLVTGAAGFIGHHSVRALLARGDDVLGLDALTPYYEPALKRARLAALGAPPRFAFQQLDITDKDALLRAARAYAPDAVLHLAAQPGVRFSVDNPAAYFDANLTGFNNVAEVVRALRPQNFVYASSSSVYGDANARPFKEPGDTSRPRSLYAATKAANELVARVYADIYGLPATGLRFFTVYGPWSRPDMAMYRFAERLAAGKPVVVYGDGHQERDFTYVGDVVAGVLAALDRPAPGVVYNLGQGRPIRLLEMLGLLADNLGVTPQLSFAPAQSGDVEATLADLSAARSALGYAPATPFAAGVAAFCDWFKAYTGAAAASARGAA
jgi:UDP-glucuronate 4-epimerase